MPKNADGGQKRGESLSRGSIVDAAIDLLDTSGESGLTFRALSERLATGPGAIYWHIANKSELLTAACDAIIVRTLGEAEGVEPEAAIRSLASGLFEAMSSRPWIGSALLNAPGQLPMVRIFERIGQQIRALGVADAEQWKAASALLHYILGVGGQNAANTALARTHQFQRYDLLKKVADEWSQLDAKEFSFARSVADQLPTHDDEADFLAGIDLILGGIREMRLRGGAGRI